MMANQKPQKKKLLNPLLFQKWQVCPLFLLFRVDPEFFINGPKIQKLQISPWLIENYKLTYDPCNFKLAP